MARSNEVDLVVRARNEASKTLDTITKAFEDFKAEMSGTNAATGKANTAIGSLGASLGALLRQAKGLSALGTIASNMDEAAGAVKRLEGSVRDGAGEFAKLAREAQAAEKVVNRLRAQVEQEGSANKSATAARKEANKELTVANRALKEAERNQEKYNQAVAKAARATRGVGVDSGAAQTSARASAGAFLAADLEQARANQARAASTVKEYTNEVARSAQALKELTPQLKAATDQERRLTSETQKQSSALKQNREALVSARNEQVQIKTVADQASAAMGNLAVSQENVARAAARTAAELARTRAQIETLNSAQAAPVATDRRGLLESRRTFVEAQIEVKRLADEMRKAQTPTEAMGAALGRAQAQAKLAADAYDRNAIALRKTAATQSNLTQFLERAATAQQRATDRQVKALAQAARAAQSNSVANRALTASTQATLAPIRQMGQAAQSTGAATQRAAAGANSLRGALAGVYGESRKSLSFLQRIRGEVLALTASYIGLQASIRTIGGVLTAFQTVEAAQSRLGVAFNGDTKRVAQELSFLEREAQRLGISFSVLAEQYSKFAVAAQSANFSAQSTRDIFISVAEAGRVQRLSVEQLEGVFKALEQMLSKGKVSAEELRGQLGDRMTGAFTLFADAIGVTTAELDSMLKKGEVLANQDTLGKVGERLRKIYGPQLAEAIASTTAEIGRFQDNIFQAQKRVAEGGFIEAFNDGLRQLNEYFQSREGRDFFLALGAALGQATRALTEFLPYVDELATALGLIALFKIARVFGDMVSSLRTTTQATIAANSAMFTWQGTVAATQARWSALAASLQVGTGAIANLRGQMAVLSSATTLVGGRFVAMQLALNTLTRIAGLAAGTFRLLWSAIGGVPGLILTGVTLAIGSWITEVDNTTAALDRHKQLLDTVVSRYDEIKGKVQDTRAALEGMSRVQLDKNVLDLRASLTQIRTDIQGMKPGGWFYSAPTDQRGLLSQITALKDAYAAGEIGAESFKKSLRELYDEITDDEIRTYAASLEENADKGLQLETALGQAAIMAKEAGSSLSGLNEDARNVGDSLEDLDKVSNTVSKTLDERMKESTDGVNSALEEMGKLIPSVAEELKRLETIEGLNKQYQDALKLAQTMGQVNQLTDTYKRALTSASFGDLGGTGDKAAFNLIRKFEGFSSEPYWDVNALRAGFGSDTVTLADGSIHKITKGMTVSMTDAVRDLTRRTEEFAKIARDQVGADRFDAFSAQQQAVLTSLAYNYGDLKSTGALNTFQGGTVEEIAEAIRGLASHNGGVNTNRRNQEADLFSNGGDFTERQYEVERKRLDTQKEYNEGLTERLALQENENSNAGRLTEQAFIQKRLAEEQKKAKEAGVVLTDEQIARIQTLAAEEYKVSQEKRDQKTSIQEANLALQQAQALETQRNALMAQYKQAVQSGDAGAQDTLQTQLIDVNNQIVAAAENARAMWEAIGGPGAAAKLPVIDALITKTRTAAGNIANVGRQTNALGLTAQQTQGLVGSFADGLVGVFDSFAQAVANGENAFKALGTAFLQFAAQFLREIATMILKQLILNALAGFGGPIGQAASGLGGFARVAHGGGTIGSTVRSRRIDPSVFSVAQYHHTGGVAGLKSNEVPAILERGETIRTEVQEDALTERMAAAERSASAEKSQAGIGTIRNIITLDEQSAHNWITSSSGEQAIWSVLGRNKGKLKSLAGS